MNFITVKTDLRFQWAALFWLNTKANQKSVDAMQCLSTNWALNLYEIIFSQFKDRNFNLQNVNDPLAMFLRKFFEVSFRNSSWEAKLAH